MLKKVGIVLLVLITPVALFAGTLYQLQTTLFTSTVEGSRQRFGEFSGSETLMLKDAGTWNLAILGTLGQILPEPLSFAAKSLPDVNMYSMGYQSDGLLITGIAITPRREGTYPVIMFNRGGNRDFGSLNVALAVLLAPFAEQGYVVVASNYRGGGGSEGADEFGGADVNDVLNLMPAVAQIESADATRIGMLGMSRGGMMTYLAMRSSDQIKTAVVMAGASDLIMGRENRPEMEEYVFSEIIPDYASNATESLEERSVVNWVDELPQSTPLLIFHGTEDDRVDYAEASSLAEKLVEFNKPHVFVTIQGGGHSPGKKIPDVWKRSYAWFDKYLNDSQQFSEEGLTESM